MLHVILSAHKACTHNLLTDQMNAKACSLQCQRSSDYTAAQYDANILSLVSHQMRTVSNVQLSALHCSFILVQSEYNIEI